MKAAHAIGLDIGGTKVAGGLVDLRRGTIVARRQLATDRADGGRRTLAASVDMALDLRDEAKRLGLPVSGIGIGVPELVDNQGIVRSRYNFEWMGLALAEHFAEPAQSGTTVVESDVRAAARGEMRYGAGRGHAISIYVTIGTGISYCLCLDGKPFAGAHGYAIHFASSPLVIRCSACGSRQAAVLEETASGPALARAYSEATGRVSASAEQVLAAASDGEPHAAAIVADAAEMLGAAIATLINMLDPEIVVIGGGLGAADGPYLPAVVEAARASIFAEDCRDLPILRATLGRHSGIIGAALCAEAA